jgi:hypothetical protein
MNRTAKGGSPGTRLRRVVAPLLLLILVAAGATPAAAGRPDEKVIVLPGASSAEGIAAGRGTTFYAGDLLLGNIFRGDVRRGTAELFIDAPEGRWAVGMATSIAHELLFVAGGATGEGYVYDTGSGATVASYQLADPNAGFINDVTVTKDGAWFTDSLQAQLYFVPVSRAGVPGPARTLTLTGPAADTSADLYTVNPATGESATIAGVSVPAVDGLLLEAGRLWAVQNELNQIAEIRLRHHLSSGVVEKVITSDLFQTPTTVARFGRRLAVVNAKFDTGFPPDADQYEVVVVHR